MVSDSTEVPIPKRAAGLEIPVFAVPREGDLGAGDTQGVRQLIDLAADLGLQSLTLLPILETVKGNDPFLPIGLYALDPLLLDVSPWALKDLPVHLYDQARQSGAAGTSSLQYNKAKRLKLDLLWQAFDQFWSNEYLRGTDRAYHYHKFCHSHAKWLPDYCLYRLLMDFEQGKESWEDWSDDYGCYKDARGFVASIAAKKTEAIERQLAYYAYIQWIAEEQWLGVKAHAESAGIELITDMDCAISPHSAEFFRSPEDFRMQMGEGRQTAICDRDLLEHLKSRLRRLAPLFDHFRIRDFRETTRELSEDETIKDFLARLPGPFNEPATSPIKVAWESLPALDMKAAQLWPAPNGQLLPPRPGAQMSFSSFGATSLRRLWSSDMLFRRRLKNQWAVNHKAYDMKTTLALLRKLFQYPARHVQISYVDLAGLENDPASAWLTRYDKGVSDLTKAPDWDEFREEFRKILDQTGRLQGVEKTEKSE